jgi:hypothetical protein
MLCDSVHHSYVDESALCVRRFGHLFEALSSLYALCTMEMETKWVKMGGWVGRGGWTIGNLLQPF